MSQFTDDDVKFMDEFGAFLQKHAKFAVRMEPLLAFHKLLVKYNGLRNKINDHVFEVRKLHVPPPPEPPKEAKKKG